MTNMQINEGKLREGARDLIQNYKVHKFYFFSVHLYLLSQINIGSFFDFALWGYSCPKSPPAYV